MNVMVRMPDTNASHGLISVNHQVAPEPVAPAAVIVASELKSGFMG